MELPTLLRAPRSSPNAGGADLPLKAGESERAAEAGADLAPKDGGADEAAEAGSALGEEERVDRHPCDEGNKSFFYSLHCDSSKRRCLHCRQWVCSYHSKPNAEGVVGGHSNCPAASRSHAREASQQNPEFVQLTLVGTDDAEEAAAPRKERSSKLTRGCTYIFEGLAVLMTLLIVAGAGYIVWMRRSGGRGAPARAEDQEELHWSWSSALWCILAALIVLGIGGPAVLFCAEQTRQAFHKGITPSLCPKFVQAGEAATEEAMGKYLASESMMGGLVTLAGVVAGACFLKENGSAPVWVLPLVLPVLLRSKIIEFRLLPFYGGGFSICTDFMPFFLSALDVFDRYSDGVTLAVMYATESSIQTRWVNTFWRSPTPVVRSMAPLFSVICLWNISAVALLISTAMQQVLGMDTKGLRRLRSFGRDELVEPGYGPEAPQAAIAADIAGFGALAGRFGKRAEQDGRRGLVKVALGFSKSLLENMPQGMLATALLGLTGRSLSGNPVVSASAVVSTLTFAKQGFDVLQGTCSISRVAYSEDHRSGLIYFMLFFPIGLLILICSAYLATKLVMIELCPEHAWTLTVGCIDLAQFD